MAGRAGDFRIIKDNRSSYNLLHHQQHIPNTPLFRAGPREDATRKLDPPARGTDGRNDQGGSPRHDFGFAKGFDKSPRDLNYPSPRKDKAAPRPQEVGLNLPSFAHPRGGPGYNHNNVVNSIKRDANNVPSSPLYISGNSPRRGGYDPPSSRRGGYDAPSPRGGGYAPPSPRRDGYDPSVPRRDGYDPSVPRRDGYDPPVPQTGGDDQFSPRKGGYDPPSPRAVAPEEVSQPFKEKLTIADVFGAGRTVDDAGKQRGSTENLFGGGDPRYGGAAGSVPAHSGPETWRLEDDPRQGDEQRRADGPVTPNYNLTHLKFDDDSILQAPPTHRAYPQEVRSPRYHDIKDFKGNINPPRGAERYHYYKRLQEQQEQQRFSYRPPPQNVFDPRLCKGPAGNSIQGGIRNGGALLFIRFPVGQGENLAVAHHAFVKAKVHDNGGRYLGMARKVYDFGEGQGGPEAIGVYHFPTMEKALLFFQLDTVLRQPDFPPPYGHAQMWVVCNAYLPDNMDLFNTFLLSQIELHPGKDKRSFFEDFQVKFEKYLYVNGAMPFVVCSYGPHDRMSIRRQAYPAQSIVTCHLFQGLEHLKWLSAEDQYCKFRSLHNQMALEKCSVFTLTKHGC